MAVFVDFGDEDNDPQQDENPPWNGRLDAVKPVPLPVPGAAACSRSGGWRGDGGISNPGNDTGKQREEAHGLAVRENLNRNSMTQALGCYPIIMSVAASIDLNTLDSLSRTCHRIRENLLQYRKMLLVSTLHCGNEHIPVERESTMRYRARAGNWYYMQDMARSSHNGKFGECARDLVSECRRCGTVVCRNCTIKPPAPVALRGRHRRLCAACVAAPLGSLVKPPLGPEVPIDSDYMQRAICRCDSEGVWLCQPCGRTILGDDSEYQGIWKWRNQYTEVLGGLGTGIGEGDRGVPCGRETECCSSREQKQETDGDAEDAREAEQYQHSTVTPLSGTSSTGSPVAAWSLTGPGSTASPSSFAGSSAASILDRRTPSPALKPGYERHEIEGIGGVVKKKRVRMVKVGACVPEWDDERAKGEILGREVLGRRRSWCGWCRRVIPSRKDYEMDQQSSGKGKKEKEGPGS